MTQTPLPKKEKTPNPKLIELRQTIINFIIPLVCFGLTLLSAGFILYPSYKAIPTVEAELASKQALEKQLRDKHATLTKLVDFRSVVDENLQLLEDVLVSEAMVPELLTQVNQIAEDSGLEVSRLNYSLTGSSKKKKDDGTLDSITVSLGVEGTYDQLVTFLDSLEDSARLVDTSAIRFSNRATANEATLDVTLTLSSPYLFVQSTATTDEPITLDVSDDAFVDLINEVRELKFYRISIEDVRSEFLDDSLESTESMESPEVPTGVE